MRHHPVSLPVIPAAPVRLADAWPATAVVAILVVSAQNLFALYVRNFGHYNAIYGSLGAVIAFMFFIYLSAQFVLFGAEMASEWPRVRHLMQHRAPERSAPLGQQLKAALRALWITPKAVDDAETGPHPGHTHDRAPHRDSTREGRGKPAEPS